MKSLCLSFNPYWVFQCAATPNIHSFIVYIIQFQSLLGFPMRCDTPQDTWLRPLIKVSIPIGFSNALRHTVGSLLVLSGAAFQSLLGFPMRCDTSTHGGMSCSSLSFQSLLGFPMRCDIQGAFGFRCNAVVSIPIGFSNALRQVGSVAGRLTRS